jgi:hypothetical protein
VTAPQWILADDIAEPSNGCVSSTAAASGGGDSQWTFVGTNNELASSDSAAAHHRGHRDGGMRANLGTTIGDMAESESNSRPVNRFDTSLFDDNAFNEAFARNNNNDTEANSWGVEFGDDSMGSSRFINTTFGDSSFSATEAAGFHHDFAHSYAADAGISGDILFHENFEALSMLQGSAHVQNEAVELEDHGPDCNPEIGDAANTLSRTSYAAAGMQVLQ